MVWRVFLVILLTAAAWGQGPSDSSLLAMINQGRDDTERVSLESLAFERPNELPGVVLVGFRKGESNYLLGKIFTGGQLVSPREACPLVLQQLGWMEADEAGRSALAQLWIEKAMLAFGETLLVDEPEGVFEGRGTPSFKKPIFAPTSGGGVRVFAWVAEPYGRQVGRNYRRSFYLFGPEAQLERVKMMDRFYHIEE